MRPELPPVIILGAARSGTRLLREAFAASGELAVVPHDVNFIWRTGNEHCSHDALDPAWCSPRIAAVIRRDLRRAARPAATAGGGRLLEKTVSNALRVDFVTRVFPDATLVHLVRDGRAVVASSRRQWLGESDTGRPLAKLRAVPWRNLRYFAWSARNRLWGSAARDGRIAIWGVRYPGIETDLRHSSVAEVCARQWVASVQGVRTSAAFSGGAGMVELRYEDMVAEPDSLAAVARRIGLADPQAVATRLRELRRAGPARDWREGMTDAEWAGASRIIEPLRSELGYR
ncbi:MAG TPA: sulfotransferase [Steroidobacteraceae bacterium]|jgi:hypothetical protein